MAAPTASRSARRGWRLSLTQQIMVGLVVGVAVGLVFPQVGVRLGFLRDIFLNLIKSLIAPLIFCSVVSGIAGGGSAQKVGRLFAKSLLWFEGATTLALVIGLVVVNVLHPGRGVALPANDPIVAGLPQTHPLSWSEILVHIFPSSLLDAMARGDVLQIVAFAVIFGLATVMAGERARPVAAWCESVTAIMFKFTDIIMRFAPLGVGAAIAATVARQGPAVLLHLGALVGSLYLALVIFLLLLLGFSALVLRLPIASFCRVMRPSFTLAFTTASSESALPGAMEAMAEFGVPRDIVGFVIPAGYSFNLDGSTLYLAVASVFVAQAAETAGAPHFGLGRQLALMAVLMLTSKGVAAIPRASLVILIAALRQFGLPAEGIVLILGVDALMDMARTSVNVVGNCLASAVVARWEGVALRP